MKILAITKKITQINKRNHQIIKIMCNEKRIKKMIQEKKIKNKKRIFLQIVLVKKLKNQDLENKKIKKQS